MKKKLKIDNDKEVVIMIEKVCCDFVCLYPKGWKIENKVVMPSVIHFEESFYIDISRESFDYFASFDTKYTRILILKGVKKDIFIHTNGGKKELLHPEDEVNGIHIMKDKDVDIFLKYKNDYTEKKTYQI